MPGKAAAGSAHRYALARRRKLALVNMLGGKCEACGTRENLTIEHKEGRDYDIRKLSSWQRLKRYWREYNSGVKLSLRCLSCNSKGGNYWSRFYEEREAERLEKEGKWPPPCPVPVPPPAPPPPEEFDEDSRA